MIHGFHRELRFVSIAAFFSDTLARQHERAGS
jgi:hypothetical protein